MSERVWPTPDNVAKLEIMVAYFKARERDPAANLLEQFWAEAFRRDAERALKDMALGLLTGRLP